MPFTTPAAYRLRNATHADLPAIMAIQRECYVTAALESLDVMQGRISQTPSTLWVAEDHAGVVAYLLTYYSHLYQIAPLGAAFKSAPLYPHHTSNTRCLYLHDLAVSRRASGQGLAGQLLQHVFAHEVQQGHARHVALVSIQQSQTFWQRQGFEMIAGSMDGIPRSLTQQLQHPPEFQTQIVHLADYPQPAFYMTRPLTLPH